MGLFVTPVIYPLQYIPQAWQPLMGLNPVAGAVLGFRYAILGDPVSRTVVGVSVATSLALFVFGLLLFRRMESRFADVI
jgi:lipopolysaccharide transport system permease protein